MGARRAARGLEISIAAMVIFGVAAAYAGQGTWFSRDHASTRHKADVLYVSDGLNQVINVYSAEPPYNRIAQITENVCFPSGLAVDAAGTLYAGNWYAACVNAAGPSIDVYPARRAAYTIVPRIFSDPFYLAVSPVDGKLYVSVVQQSRILVFSKGSRRPESTIAIPGSYARSIAFDASGTLYVAYFDNRWDHRNHIARLNAATGVLEDTGIFFHVIGGLAFDGGGNLLVTDVPQVGTDGMISVYPPGSTVPKTVYTGFQGPYAIAFGAGSRRMFVNDVVANEVAVLDYPSGARTGTIMGCCVGYGVAVGRTP